MSLSALRMHENNVIVGSKYKASFTTRLNILQHSSSSEIFMKLKNRFLKCLPFFPFCFVKHPVIVFSANSFKRLITSMRQLTINLAIF